MIPLLYLALVRPNQECCIQFRAPWHNKDIDILERAQQRPTTMAGGWSTGGMKSGWENFFVQQVKGNLTAICNYLIRGYREDRVRLFESAQRMDIRQWPQVWTWKHRLGDTKIFLLYHDRGQTLEQVLKEAVGYLPWRCSRHNWMCFWAFWSDYPCFEFGGGSSPRWPLEVLSMSYSVILSFYKLHKWQLIFCCETEALCLHLCRNYKFISSTICCHSVASISRLFLLFCSGWDSELNEVRDYRHRSTPVSWWIYN